MSGSRNRGTKWLTNSRKFFSSDWNDTSCLLLYIPCNAALEIKRCKLARFAKVTKRTSTSSQQEGNWAEPLAQNPRLQWVHWAVRSTTVGFFLVFFAVCGKKTKTPAASGEKKNGGPFADSVTHCGFRFPERSLAGYPLPPPHFPLQPLPHGKMIKSQKALLLLLLLPSHTNTMSPLPANESIIMHITDVEEWA